MSEINLTPVLSGIGSQVEPGTGALNFSEKGDSRFQKFLEKFVEDVETAKDGTDSLERSISDEKVESKGSTRIPLEMAAEIGALFQSIIQAQTATGEVIAVDASQATDDIALLSPVETSASLVNGEVVVMLPVGTEEAQPLLAGTEELPLVTTPAAAENLFSNKILSETDRMVQDFSQRLAMVKAVPVTAETQAGLTTEVAAMLPQELTDGNGFAKLQSNGFNYFKSSQTQLVIPPQVPSEPSDQMVNQTEATETPATLMANSQVAIKGKVGAIDLPGLQTEGSLAKDLSKSNQEQWSQVVTVLPQSSEFIVENAAIVEQNSGHVLVKAEDIYAQIVEQAQVMMNDGNSEMKIKLKPEHLGQLQLRISMENQLISARFVAESEQVKAIIETNLVDLEKMLNENGVQVQNLQVSVGGDQNESNLFQQRSRNGSNGSRWGSEVQESEVIAESAPLASDSLLDVIA